MKNWKRTIPYLKLLCLFHHVMQLAFCVYQVEEVRTGFI